VSDFVINPYIYAAAAPAFDPLTDVAWVHAHWAEGPEFVALATVNNTTPTSLPDEIGTADLTPNAGTLYLAAWTDPVSGKGPFPAWLIPGRNGPSTFSSIGPPHSIVVIAAASGVTGTNYLTDGKDSTHRRLIRDNASNVWEHFAGAAAGTSDVLRLDGSDIATATAGDHAMTGITLGSSYDGVGGVDFEGHILFVGIYDGDVRSDGGWTDFIDWVDDHYTLTV
jgi:hypothetical protein